MDGFFSSVAGATLRWLDLLGDGLPVVFVHGLGCAPSCGYPRVASDSALNGRHKILIGLSGFGYSDGPHDFSYNIHIQTRVVEQLLNHLCLQCFALFGYSMGEGITIGAAGLLSERVIVLLVSELDLLAGGGEYSRHIVAQTEAAFITESCARMLVKERSPWAGCLQNNAPWAVQRAASSLMRGSDTPWFTQLCQLHYQKRLIVGELSLPYADIDLTEAQGIPVGTVPRGGHSTAWENPQGLAQIITNQGQKNTSSEREFTGLSLERYPAQLGEFRDVGPTPKTVIARGFTAAKRHLRFIMHR